LRRVSKYSEEFRRQSAMLVVDGGSAGLPPQVALRPAMR
jgi:hypothetical protein